MPVLRADLAGPRPEDKPVLVRGGLAVLQAGLAVLVGRPPEDKPVLVLADLAVLQAGLVVPVGRPAEDKPVRLVRGGRVVLQADQADLAGRPPEDRPVLARGGRAGQGLVRSQSRRPARFIPAPQLRGWCRFPRLCR